MQSAFYQEFYQLDFKQSLLMMLTRSCVVSTCNLKRRHRNCKQDCFSVQDSPPANSVHRHAFCSCDLDLDMMTLMNELKWDIVKIPLYLHTENEIFKSLEHYRHTNVTENINTQQWRAVRREHLRLTVIFFVVFFSDTACSSRSVDNGGWVWGITTRRATGSHKSLIVL